MLRRLNATLGADPERRQICTAVCVGVRAAAERRRGVALRDRLRRASVAAAGARPTATCAPVGRPGTLLGAFPEGRWTATDVDARRRRRARPLHRRRDRHARRRTGASARAPRGAAARASGRPTPTTIAGGIDAALQAFGEQRDDVAVLVLAGRRTTRRRRRRVGAGASRGLSAAPCAPFGPD